MCVHMCVRTYIHTTSMGVKVEPNVSRAVVFQVFVFNLQDFTRKINACIYFSTGTINSGGISGC